MGRRSIASRFGELQPNSERLKEWLGDHYVDIEGGEGEGVNDSRWEFKSHLARIAFGVQGSFEALVINHQLP